MKELSKYEATMMSYLSPEDGERFLEGRKYYRQTFVERMEEDMTKEEIRDWRAWNTAADIEAINEDWEQNTLEGSFRGLKDSLEGNIVIHLIPATFAVIDWLTRLEEKKKR